MSVAGRPLSREEVRAGLRALANGHHPEEIEPPPPFPLEVLPPALRTYVEQAAASFPVPPEMIAMPMLGAAGAVVGHRAHLALKGSWHEYASLFFVIVAPPGRTKTPALLKAMWPTQEVLQGDEQAAWEVAKAAHDEAMHDWKSRPAKERGEQPKPPPPMRDLWSSDTTMEKLGDMLSRTPGITLYSDELAGWVKRMNQYRAGGDREQYMSMWAATPIKVDRKSGGSLLVKRPVICVVGSIQPDVVPVMQTEGNVRDGFVERILPLVPEIPVKTWNEETVPSSVFADVAALWRALDRIPEGIGVELSPEAKREWIEWSNENNRLAAELEGLLGGFYTKLEAHVARFALVLHLLHHPDDPAVMLSAGRMRDAIELGELHRAHMQRFIPLLGTGAATSPKGAGLWARIQRLFHKAAREESSNSSNSSKVRTTPEGISMACLSKQALLRGLGNVKTEELTIELDRQTDHKGLLFQEHKTSTKPLSEWCLPLAKNDVRTFEQSNNSNYSNFPPGNLRTIRPSEETAPWEA